jgi:hypothetical protein
MCPAVAMGCSPYPGTIHPESETNFLRTINGAQFTFIKNDKREVAAVIHHMEGRAGNR